MKEIGVYRYEDLLVAKTDTNVFDVERQRAVTEHIK